MKLYYLAVLVPEPVRTAILTIQQDISRMLGDEGVLRSPPHITLLAPFPFEEELLPQLSQELEKICASFRPFSVVLSGYDAFPSHTVFVRVLQNRSLRVLEHMLWSRLTMHYPMVAWKPRVRFHPHVTIATKIAQEQTYFSLMKAFGDKPYHASFAVPELSLMSWDGESWEVVRGFGLKGSL